jgi:hypothetical protein
MNFSIGSFMAYWINFACSNYSERLGNWDWRITMLFQLLAPVCVIALLWFCPESPRWYIKKDRVEEAVRTLQLIRDDPERVQTEVTDICRAIQYEKDNQVAGYAALWRDRSIRQRLRKWTDTDRSASQKLTSSPAQCWPSCSTSGNSFRAKAR